MRILTLQNLSPSPRWARAKGAWLTGEQSAIAAWLTWWNLCEAANEVAKWPSEKNWRDMIIESPWAHCKYRITKLLSCWLREQIPWVSRSWLVADSKVTKACYLSRSPKFVLKLHGTHEETEIWSFNCFWMALGQALHVVLAPGVWSWGNLAHSDGGEVPQKGGCNDCYILSQFFCQSLSLWSKYRGTNVTLEHKDRKWGKYHQSQSSFWRGFSPRRACTCS